MDELLSDFFVAASWPEFLYLIFLIIIMIPICIGAGYILFFKNWRDFGETLIALVKPGLVAACEGEWYEQLYRRFRFVAFMFVCAILVYHINMAINRPLQQFTEWCCSLFR